MSGGSFNYFYSRASEEVARVAGTLESMADACDVKSTDPPEERWGSKDVVEFAVLAALGAHLRAIGLHLRGVSRMLDALQDVTQAIEWWKSGDSGPDSVVEEWQKLKDRKMGMEKKR